MGVIYHAHARFWDEKLGRITVPAPCDPQTPHAQWWYDTIAARAHGLAQAGFTAILLPPVSKTQSGRYPTGDGYGVFDHYDIGWKVQAGSRETRFGDREQLQRAVAVARACGLDVYCDVVMHQLSGSNAGDGMYRYLGADGAPGRGRFPKDHGCFRGAPPRRPEDPVPVPRDDFAFGDEFVYANCQPARYTTQGMIDFADWLTRSLDVQGYRVDDAKGTWTGFLHEWMTSASMADGFCVAEYFDGNPDALHWWAQDQMAGRSCVFDFTLHWALQAICGGGDMRMLQDAGYIARNPLGAVTFVDNPDTDLSPGQQIIGCKLLAYAFILTAEGYPSVYHKDYAEDPGCYGLKRWIDNLVWIHEHLANGTTSVRYADGQVIVFEREGVPGLLTAISNDGWNRRAITCQTRFPPFTQLHDYTGRHGDIWTDSEGRASFVVPSNAYETGQSYLCFSRAGQGRAAIAGHFDVTQRFSGAADLDIPALANGKPVILPRLFPEEGTTLSATLRLGTASWPAGASVTLGIVGPDGVPVGAHEWRAQPSTLFRMRPAVRGWHTLTLSAQAFDAEAAFTLQVSYSAPQVM